MAYGRERSTRTFGGYDSLPPPAAAAAAAATATTLPSEASAASLTAAPLTRARRGAMSTPPHPKKPLAKDTAPLPPPVAVVVATESEPRLAPPPPPTARGAAAVAAAMTAPPPVMSTPSTADTPIITDPYIAIETLAQQDDMTLIKFSGTLLQLFTVRALQDRITSMSHEQLVVIQQIMGRLFTSFRPDLIASLSDKALNNVRIVTQHLFWQGFYQLHPLVVRDDDSPSQVLSAYIHDILLPHLETLRPAFTAMLHLYRLNARVGMPKPKGEILFTFLWNTFGQMFSDLETTHPLLFQIIQDCFVKPSITNNSLSHILTLQTTLTLNLFELIAQQLGITNEDLRRFQTETDVRLRTLLGAASTTAGRPMAYIPPIMREVRLSIADHSEMTTVTVTGAAAPLLARPLFSLPSLTDEQVIRFFKAALKCIPPAFLRDLAETIAPILSVPSGTPALDHLASSAVQEAVMKPLRFALPDIIPSAPADTASEDNIRHYETLRRSILSALLTFFAAALSKNQSLFNELASTFKTLYPTATSPRDSKSVEATLGVFAGDLQASTTTRLASLAAPFYPVMPRKIPNYCSALAALIFIGHLIVTNLRTTEDQAAINTDTALFWTYTGLAVAANLAALGIETYTGLVHDYGRGLPLKDLKKPIAFFLLTFAAAVIAAFILDPIKNWAKSTYNPEATEQSSLNTLAVNCYFIDSRLLPILGILAIAQFIRLIVGPSVRAAKACGLGPRFGLGHHLHLASSMAAAYAVATPDDGTGGASAPAAVGAGAPAADISTPRTPPRGPRPLIAVLSPDSLRAAPALALSRYAAPPGTTGSINDGGAAAAPRR